MWTSFSTAVGGGVRGKGDGIARGTMIQVGATIEEFHLFTGRYHRGGGMTIGSVVGKGINGTTNEYPMIKFNKTGATGERTGIGRSKIPGVSRVWSPERDHNSRLERFNHNLRKNRNPERSILSAERQPNHNNPGRNPERSSHRSHSHNAGRHHKNLNHNMKNLKEGGKVNRIENRMTKVYISIIYP
jgi:hypothetical protein